MLILVLSGDRTTNAINVQGTVSFLALLLLNLDKSSKENLKAIICCSFQTAHIFEKPVLNYVCLQRTVLKKKKLPKVLN